MVSSIESGGISQLQMLRAAQAFKSSTVQQPKHSEITDTVSVSSESQAIKQKVVTDPISEKNKKMAGEINQYMNKFGENTNLTEKDVNYALRFGRSVLVNYSA